MWDAQYNDLEGGDRFREVSEDLCKVARGQQEPACWEAACQRAGERCPRQRASKNGGLVALTVHAPSY